MAKTGKSGAIKGAAKAAQKVSAVRPKAAVLREQMPPGKPANDTVPDAAGQRLVQLSIRITDADRWIVHGTAAALGMDAQTLVILALQAYGVDIGKDAPQPDSAPPRVRNGRSTPAGNQRRAAVGVTSHSSREPEIIEAARKFTVDVIDRLAAALANCSPHFPIGGVTPERNIKQQQTTKKRR